MDDLKSTEEHDNKEELIVNMEKEREPEINLPSIENRIDPNCILNIKERLVRVEYPGEVKNFNKAIETLGGIENIETCVVDRNRRLNLRFHPSNKFNKSCFADRDFKPGILIRVKKEALIDQGIDKTQQQIDYEVRGVSVLNFTFNRMCDFQSLPLIAQQPENKHSKTEYIYEKIMPAEIPTADWLLNCDETRNLDPFLIPVHFSKYDKSNAKLNVGSKEDDKDVQSQKSSGKGAKQQKAVSKIFGRNRQKISIFFNFTDKEVPSKPLDEAVKMFEHRIPAATLERMKQLFEERPIWTKSAIRYNTGISKEHIKYAIAAVAYYFNTGPWKRLWVKFGYDPRTIPNARIYQTLDYRVKTSEGTSRKMTAKNQYMGVSATPDGEVLKKVTLMAGVDKKATDLDERCYILRPQTIPPARQMFYQICDLLLPEIQEMISTLPKMTTFQCNPKHGWLHATFLNQCRQIVNKHVLDAVRIQLVNDSKLKAEGIKKSAEAAQPKETSTPMDYCSQMLNNIRRGIYKNVNIDAKPKTAAFSSGANQKDFISLSSDEEEDQFTEIITSSIPDNFERNEEDEEEEGETEEDNQSSDEAEIDMEVAEEIKQFLAQIN